MGTVGIKMKIMPTSPEVDMKKLEGEVKHLVEHSGGRSREYSIEPVAFGLMSLNAFFEWPEEKELEELENEIKTIKTVNSTQIMDMRRLI
jgi:translation elongation factor aEF-1 beta